MDCNRPDSTAPPDEIQPRLATVEAVEANGGYEAIDLGTHVGNPTLASDINLQGQVVGYSSAAEEVMHATLWTKETEKE